MSDFTPTEMMTIAAARALTNDDVCFVGIGAPSAACNVARLTHAPDITLIYESGTVGTKPDVLPLSIGDGELCDTALFTVSVPEMFRYWLQGGRITTGFLGGAQIDRFANLNTTVVGPYEQPKVRLPGGGGAPEIASNCGQVFITMALSKRGFVDKLNFITSMGYGEGGDHRERLGMKTKGPTRVITDLCILEPDPVTKELTVVSIHKCVTREQIIGNCGWPIKFVDQVIETPVPTETELTTLRDINARTKKAHQVTLISATISELRSAGSAERCPPFVPTTSERSRSRR
jgi:glutaconate CoA-transferase subunit B